MLSVHSPATRLCLCPAPSIATALGAASPGTHPLEERKADLRCGVEGQLLLLLLRLTALAAADVLLPARLVRAAPHPSLPPEGGAEAGAGAAGGRATGVQGGWGGGWGGGGRGGGLLLVPAWMLCDGPVCRCWLLLLLLLCAPRLAWLRLIRHEMT